MKAVVIGGKGHIGTYLCPMLVKNGFEVPILVNERIRSYELSEFTRDHEKEIMKIIS